mmetsp:Transcript_40967/g.62374  ORF Transcript_40967/g.62374 Transcript_40967/m.62374 type:complete len:134 (-) Transcript_40967:308-709(-)
MTSNQAQGVRGSSGDSKEKKLGAPDFDTDLDEFVTCAHTFRRLKDVVQGWLSDALKDDFYASLLIENLQRWLTSPKTSKLYDPQLHRLVHKLMKKNFTMLLHRLKKLGCKVIYASFYKVLIHTEKQTLSEAES